MHKKIWLPILLLILFIGLKTSGALRWLNLEYVATQKILIIQLVANHKYFLMQLFVLGFTLVAVLHIPGVGFLSLLSGALFGPVAGTIVASISHVVAAFAAFFSARYLFHDYFQQKFSKKLAKFNKESKINGTKYLILLHLIPVVTFQTINILAGISKINFKQLFWGTLIGTFPYCVAFVNAGQLLWSANTTAELFTNKKMVSFQILIIIFVSISFYISNKKLEQQTKSNWQ